MRSQAYNLLWLNRTEPAYPDDPALVSPIPDITVRNILNIAEQNPEVDVQLWIHAPRLTKGEWQCLKNLTANSLSGNLYLRNLQDIPNVNLSFLALRDNSLDWRANKNSLIWQQVDIARLLICLDGHYDQTFYSDADITNIQINSDERPCWIIQCSILFLYQRASVSPS